MFKKVLLMIGLSLVIVIIYVMNSTRTLHRVEDDERNKLILATLLKDAKSNFLSNGRFEINLSFDSLDVYGTPVQLEKLGNNLAIRSAGPDKLFHTEDDETLKDGL